MSEVNAIRFYSVSDAYGEFSNFAPFPITLDGERWPTSEHYFQAQKYQEIEYRNEVRKARSPMIAARLGRSRSRPLRKDWESVKVQVMRAALRAKFTQYESLRTLLLETGEARIIESTENDSYWGDGGDGRGRNQLGLLLMELRQALRSSFQES